MNHPVRAFQILIAIGNWLYALTLWDARAEIGVVVYMSELSPSIPQFLAITFVVCGALILSLQRVVSMRTFLLLCIPQFTYTAFAIGRWNHANKLADLGGDPKLTIAALWLHPFITATILVFAYVLISLAWQGVEYDELVTDDSRTSG